MSTTVLEALQNAQANLDTLGFMGLSGNPIFTLVREQLANGIEALESGKAPDFILQDSMFADINK